MLGMLDNQGEQDLIYYLINGAQDGYVYYMNSNSVLTSKINISRGIRPVVVINKDKLNKGTGSKEDPFTIGE